MSQLINQTPQNDINVFVNTFKKKSKLAYRWRKDGIRKLAKDISPAYRDFVNTLLSNSKLKISRYSGGKCHAIELGETHKLTRRATNEIYIDFNNCRVFAHELGHSVDMLFGCNNVLSCSVLLEGDKTLFDIFSEELNSNHEQIHEFIMSEYAQSIDTNIYKGAFDIFMNNMPKYLELGKIEAPKKRHQLQQELYKCGFVEVYYQMHTKKCFQVLEQKYIPILDALSSIYDVTGLILTGHEINYFKMNKKLPTEEFFANVFADKIMANHTRYDSLIKLMPRSFAAFEKLFALIYERIQNGKKFTDLELKPVKRPNNGSIELDEEEYEETEEE